MGHTIKSLYKKSLLNNTIFNNRFVIELCERVHVHYRNLRINMSVTDWQEFCKGCIAAFERWNKRGCPTITEEHIELCRKHVASEAFNEGIQINLNNNLYPKYDGKIFSEGANFKEDLYIHLKIRDLRIELSIEEFKELAHAFDEAKRELKDCVPTTSI